VSENIQGNVKSMQERIYDVAGALGFMQDIIANADDHVDNEHFPHFISGMLGVLESGVKMIADELFLQLGIEEPK